MRASRERPDVPVAAVFVPPALRPRQPLGLPAGSVRALLILMVLGTIITLLLMPKERNVTVPIHLYYLLFLMTGAYFSTRSRPAGSTPSSEASPLYLPRGTVRIVIIAGFFGVMGFAFVRDPWGFLDRPLLSDRDRQATLVLPLVMMGTYLLGIITSSAAQKFLAGPLGVPAWYQDVTAWVSVLAVFGLGADTILQLVVFPTLASPPQLPPMQLALSSIIAFYFGLRAS
ncbi:MAG: hypothetical protein JNM56_21305 [Planctomycetia bacterium]|nr:hypothetical protein [Planctomycetia bacterium]